MKTHSIKNGIALATSLFLLAACGGGGDSTSSTAAPASPTAPSSLTIAGTAATGAAIANTPIEVECANGATASATSAANGDFTLQVPNGVAPCLLGLEVQGGELLSIFAGQERANITPLTQLLVAYFAGRAGLPANFTAEQLLAQNNIESLVTTENLNAGLAAVRMQILNAYGIDIGVNFLNEQIVTPDENGMGANEADGRLEALQTAGGVNENGTPMASDNSAVNSQGNTDMSTGTPPPPPPPTEPDTGTGSGAASECFNETLAMVGTTATYTYQSTTPSATSTTTIVNTNSGPTTFEGNQAIEQRSEIPGFGGTTSTFFSQEGLVTTTFGTVSEFSNANFSSESRTVFNPALVGDELTLQAGQSLMVTESGTTTTNVSQGGVAQPTQTVEFTRSVTTTFVGIEPVTVPAGTFQACRFREETSDAQGMFVINAWVSVGSGVFVKTSSDDFDNVLVEGEINGMPIQP